MFKLFFIVVLMTIAFVAAKPKPLVPYSAPLVAAAPVVTATSSQYFARNYNGLAAAYTSAPVVAAYSSPFAAAYTAGYPAYDAYVSPYASAYTAAYSAPLAYTF